MNVVKFTETTSSDKNHIIFCIVDRILSCQDNTEIIKTISDWTIQNITILGYTVLVSADEDTLLRTAADTDAEYAVVLSTGLEFVNSYDWFDCVENLCKDYFFIAGHILDRKEFYYELHEQCYVLNLQDYNKLNRPSIGQQSFFAKHVEITPHRSTENYHDDYTPLWIRPGLSSNEYLHKAHGGKLISIALENNLPIRMFDEALKNNKRYYYPEYSSYHDQVCFLYMRQGFCNSAAVYLNNSENIVPITISGPIQQLVVAASGLNWVHYLNQHGFDTKTKVKFYDYSFLTLEYIKFLIENWDGMNYESFALSYYHDKFRGIAESIPFCGSTNFENISPEGWHKVKHTVKFEYHWTDMLNTDSDISWISNTPGTVINLTNVFNYIGTATVRSVKNRIHCENSFITKIKKIVPDATVIFTRRAASGFADVVTTCDIKANDLILTDIQQLTKPTWHSQDWSK